MYINSKGEAEVKVIRGRDARPTQYVLHGWHLSYFSGKTRAYLRNKGIDFVDHAVDAHTLMRKVPRRTGAVVMPVLVTPEGEWLQDSSHIAEVLDARFPLPAVMPTTPCQRIAVRLLEAWADEWWVPIAMHYRWVYADNYALFERDAGRALLPHFPRFVQNRLAGYVANKLRGYLPSVGVVPEQAPLLERWTEATLDLLDRHFSRLPYLFGERPSIADFALMGPMYGHLSRDPWPARHLIEPRPRLKAWVERMNQPSGNFGAFYADDLIPPTLMPLLQRVFDEFYPMIERIRDVTRRALLAHPARHAKLPRALEMIEFPMGDGVFRRAAMPYSLWMMQRVMDDYTALPLPQRVAVDAALAGERGHVALDLGMRVRRSALRICANLDHDAGRDHDSDTSLTGNPVPE